MPSPAALAILVLGPVIRAVVPAPDPTAWLNYLPGGVIAGALAGIFLRQANQRVDDLRKVIEEERTANDSQTKELRNLFADQLQKERDYLAGQMQEARDRIAAERESSERRAATAERLAERVVQDAERARSDARRDSDRLQDLMIERVVPALTEATEALRIARKTDATREGGRT